MNSLLSTAILTLSALLVGCQVFAPTVPPGVTFNDPHPRWSWTGTWRGNSGMIFNIMQHDNQWVASGGVSAKATLSGNRAVGWATNGTFQSTFDLLLSDDGMYAQGTTAANGLSMRSVLTRISGPPQPLPTASSPSDAAANGVPSSAPDIRNGQGYIGVVLKDVAGGNKSGGEITRVTPGKPAAASGLQQGDVIFTVNGQFVENTEEIKRMIAASPNAALELGVLRSGQRLTVTVTPTIYQSGSVNESVPVQVSPNSAVSAGAMTADEFAAIKRDNDVAARARFNAMGLLTIQGSVHRVSQSKVVLTGVEDDLIRIECTFPLRPNQRQILLSGQNRYFTPAAVMNLHKGNLVTVRGRFETHNMNDISDCKIIVP